MSKFTKKAVVVKIDNATPSSFYGYTQPKRVRNNQHRKLDVVKIVNLDPTDDPDQVCEAYRQIKIRDQNRRIRKNKAYLAEQRRLAAISAEKDEMLAAKQAEEKARRSKLRSEGLKDTARMIKAKACCDLMLSRLITGRAISPKTIGASATVISKEVSNIRGRGHDVVSVNSSGSRLSADLKTSLWCIDKFKRLNQPLNDTYTSDKKIVRALLEDGFSKGYLITTADVLAARSNVINTIGEMRGDGWVICTVKNNDVDERPRGWVMPCVANGLVRKQST